MRPRSTPSLLIVLLLAATAPLPAEEVAAATPNTAERQAAKRLATARAYLERVRGADWVGMSSFLADNARYVDFSMEYFGREPIDRRGRPAILDFWRTSHAEAQTLGVELDLQEHFVAGPNVYLLGVSKVRSAGAAWGLTDDTVEIDFRLITHLRINDGRVEYHADHVDYASAMAQVASRRNAGPTNDDQAPPSDPSPALPAAGRALSMQSIGGSAQTLEDWRRANGLLVVFVSNTCPYVLDWADRFSRLEAIADSRQIGVVVVNPNARRRDTTDSPDAMAEFARQHLGDLPYLIDEDSRLADLLDARRTPEALLFDAEWRLVYRGLIDDHSGPLANVGEHYLNDALDAVTGLGSMPESTAPLGCAVQRPRRRR